MKKKRITYAIKGFMTYVAVIFFGKARMKVTFTDGSITGAGIKPAIFTTENYILQKGIEQSEQFKKGLIYIHSIYELDEEVEVLRNAAPAPSTEDLTPEDKPEAPATNGEETPSTEDLTPEDKPETPSAKDEADGNEEEAPAAKDSEGEGNVKVFTCNDDAKDYLESEFGVARNKMMNREAIIACGKEHGVDIVFK